MGICGGVLHPKSMANDIGKFAKWRELNWIQIISMGELKMNDLHLIIKVN